MLLCGGAQELSSSLSLLSNLNSNASFFPPLRSYTTQLHRHFRCLPVLNPSHPFPLFPQTPKFPQLSAQNRPTFISPVFANPVGNFVEQFSGGEISAIQSQDNLDFSPDEETESFDLDDRFESTDLRKLPFTSPVLEVKELAELPENWRRSKLAWLCKELPAHKRQTITRLLNAQKKWIRQEDATYVAVHCIRIRENEVGFRVYKWMIQQHWFRFDFPLATKLADYMGRERKYAKCRQIFDDIINQGRVPSESTFHILVVAYLSAEGEDCLEEACSVYNRMIQLGGYRPRLSLHNALFRALLSKPGKLAKRYLKQAEFVFHNISTSGFEIHQDIYGGLIWLHSYQETIDRERILALRKEMESAGIKESRDVLLSILRAGSKVGDVDYAEATWTKLLSSEGGMPSQAFVYKMEVYSKAGEPKKSLEIFKQMRDKLGSVNVVAYHKIIGVLSKVQELELVDSLMEDLIRSSLKPLTPSYINLMSMYFQMSLHDKIESAFVQCVEKCSPNRAIYSIYLDSLVQTDNIEKAEEIFNQMLDNGAIGVNSRSCNTILRGYLSSGAKEKAESIYNYMRQKKYEVDSTLVEKIKSILSSSKKLDVETVSMKLSRVQREMLVGLLLGGLRIESEENGKQTYVKFVFKDKIPSHSILKILVYDEFREWLHPSNLPVDDRDGDDHRDLPSCFFTSPNVSFRFYADQFWPRGKQVIPKLVHRWLSPQVLAYWYMYSGHRTSSGDILLKLRGSRDGVERIIVGLRSKSLDPKVKQKGKVFWIGLLETNSAVFWKIIEPYVPLGMRDLLKADGQNMEIENNSRLHCDECDYEEGQEDLGSEVSDNDEI